MAEDWIKSLSSKYKNDVNEILSLLSPDASLWDGSTITDELLYEFEKLSLSGKLSEEGKSLYDSLKAAREDRDPKLAQKIITGLNTYTEYPPSGKGYHLFVLGNTKTFKSNDIGIEVFANAQFFTMTGNLTGNQSRIGQKRKIIGPIIIIPAITQQTTQPGTLFVEGDNIKLFPNVQQRSLLSGLQSI